MHFSNESVHRDSGRPALRDKVASSAALNGREALPHLALSIFQMFNAKFHFLFPKVDVQVLMPHVSGCSSAFLVVLWIHPAEASRCVLEVSELVLEDTSVSISHGRRPEPNTQR